MQLEKERKKNKNVYLMSAMHSKVIITDESHPKFVVDIINQRARYHTCKTETRR